MTKRRRHAPEQGRAEADASSLKEAKRRVSGAMLGRDGVHAVGLRAGENAVVVYVLESDPARRADLAARARPLAAPHQVIVEESEEARRA